MGLLEDLLAGMLQGQGQAPGGHGQVPGGQPQLNRNQLGGLLQAVVAMLSDPRTGGLEGLVKRFQDAGLGDVVNSWIGTGQNRPIDSTQLERVFPNEVTQMSQQAGLPPQQGGSILAQILPQLIDQLTPRGQVPQQSQMGDLTGQLLKSLLR
jgi:uncharacterized protein YidB (DUF937 family)